MARRHDETDEADLVREQVIADLRARLTRAYRLIAVAALAGVLGREVIAQVLPALLGLP